MACGPSTVMPKISNKNIKLSPLTISFWLQFIKNNYTWNTHCICERKCPLAMRRLQHKARLRREINSPPAFQQRAHCTFHESFISAPAAWIHKEPIAGGGATAIARPIRSIKSELNSSTNTCLLMCTASELSSCSSASAERERERKKRRRRERVEAFSPDCLHWLSTTQSIVHLNWCFAYWWREQSSREQKYTSLIRCGKFHNRNTLCDIMDGS